MTTRSPEVRLLASMAVFGLLVGVAYWFLTYETAGTLLLVGFGLASGTGAAVILERRHARVGTPREGTTRFPGPGWAPFVVALGLGGLVLGAVFGPWLAIGGVLVAVAGGWIWLSTAMAEADLVERFARATIERTRISCARRDNGREEIEMRASRTEPIRVRMSRLAVAAGLAWMLAAVLSGVSPGGAARAAGPSPGTSAPASRLPGAAPPRARLPPQPVTLPRRSTS